MIRLRAWFKPNTDETIQIDSNIKWSNDDDRKSLKTKVCPYEFTGEIHKLYNGHVRHLTRETNKPTLPRRELIVTDSA